MEATLNPSKEQPPEKMKRDETFGDNQGPNDNMNLDEYSMSSTARNFFQN